MGVTLVTLCVVNACQGDAVLTAEGLLDSSNESWRFSYKGEWANMYWHI